MPSAASNRNAETRTGLLRREPMEEIMARGAFLLTAIFISSAFGTTAATTTPSGGNACEREMIRAAGKYGVPLGMLYAVGLTETGRKGSLQPYALNVEGRAVYGGDKHEALRQF